MREEREKGNSVPHFTGDRQGGESLWWVLLLYVKFSKRAPHDSWVARGDQGSLHAHCQQHRLTTGDRYRNTNVSKPAGAGGTLLLFWWNDFGPSFEVLFTDRQGAMRQVSVSGDYRNAHCR